MQEAMYFLRIREEYIYIVLFLTTKSFKAIAKSLLYRV